MQIIATAIAEVLILEPAVFRDDRGYFLESYNRRAFDEVGIAEEFVQDSASFSLKGALRGLHYQKGEHAQAKLVRVVSGRILDVALDIRAGSPTFGQTVAVELSGDNNRQMYIPKGFAHGFAVLSDSAHVAYKTDDFYAPESEGAIDALDPKLAIDWGMDAEDWIRSAKDLRARSWQDYCRTPDFFYQKDL